MNTKPLKVYVLVRRDLPWPQPAIQACHAVASLAVRNAADPQVVQWMDESPTLVLLGVENEEELIGWEKLLHDRGDIFCCFSEPDFGDKKTALAVHPRSDAGLFRSIPLL